MTTELVIKEKLADLVKGMLAKGFRQPESTFILQADKEPMIMFGWLPAGRMFRNYDGDSAHFAGADFSECLVKAHEWLDKQPTVEQRQFREFAEILAKAVEVGKQNGIDAVLVNPLEKAMRDLSKNALMFQSEAA
jgi:hypothetical protein